MKKIFLKKDFLFLIAFFSLIFLFQTTAYSAFSSTMNIKGLSYARVNTDIRITEFSVHEVSSNTITSYEEFSKNSISSNITLPSNESFITYKIEVTNYGSNNMGIIGITGLQSNLSYELIDYNLKDKICDETGKCNNLAKKRFYIKITGNQGTYNLNLSFNFKPFYKITYTNIINNNYPSEILHDETLNVSIGNDNAPGVLVLSGGANISNYSYINGIINVPFITNNIEIKGFSIVENFNYTGNEQQYEVQHSGIYKLETWGAQGGNNKFLEGGYGGYSVGNIELSEQDKLYINIGGQGKSAYINNSFSTIAASPNPILGGYNGGGNDIQYCETVYGTSGGGATHIATISGQLSTLEQYKDTDKILIVSGGGGGSTYWTSSYSTTDGIKIPTEQSYQGGSGGGITGVSAQGSSSNQAGILTYYGGTQTAPGNGNIYINPSDNQIKNGIGTFGLGGLGRGGGCIGAGGGGGYYGGTGGYDNSAGAGGSGYIGNTKLTNKHMTCFNCETSNQESTKTQTTTSFSLTATSDYAKQGNGYAKLKLIKMIKEIEENIEITNYSLYETYKATSTNELFTHKNILSNIELSNSDSTVIYKIDITNFGTTFMGILDITGLQSSLNYEIIDYNLKEKLCDSNGKCNKEATKTLYIKISGQPGKYNINLEFNFKPFYNITYKNLTNDNYPTEIFHGETLNIDVSNKTTVGVKVLINKLESNRYTYKNGILNVPNISGNIEIKGFDLIQTFDYTGGEQNYQITYSGLYKIEVWGASGGTSIYNSTYYSGGYGGYSTGNITLKEGSTLYVNVGGMGKNSTNASQFYEGGYNGGGDGKPVNLSDCLNSSGGGATHIASSSGILSSLHSKINSIYIVAGAGGGGGKLNRQATNFEAGYGGHGGGISGTNGSFNVGGGMVYSVGTGGNQTIAGTNATSSVTGDFGQGANGSDTTYEHSGGAGGGGGFYGGGAGYTNSGAGGGSGYIGNPILTNKHMTCYNCTTSNEETTKTISTTNVSETPTADYAKKGNGYARITLIEMIKE